MAARTSDDQKRQKPRKPKLSAKQKKEQQLLVAKLAFYFSECTRMLLEGKREDDEQFNNLLDALQLYRENNLGVVHPIEEKRTKKQGDILLYSDDNDGDFFASGTVVTCIKDVPEFKKIVGIVIEHDEYTIKLQTLNTGFDSDENKYIRVSLPLNLWELYETTEYVGLAGLYYEMACSFPEKHDYFNDLEQFEGEDKLLQDLAVVCNVDRFQRIALKYMSSDASRAQALCVCSPRANEPLIKIYAWKHYLDNFQDPNVYNYVIETVLFKSTSLNEYVTHIVGGERYGNLINHVIQNRKDDRVMPWLQQLEQTRKHRKVYADDVRVIKAFYGKLTQKTLCCMFEVKEYDVHTRISILDHITGDKRYLLAVELFNEMYREHQISSFNSIIASRIREILMARGYENLDPDILSNLIAYVDHDSPEGIAVIKAMSTRSCLARFEKIQLTYLCQGHKSSLQSVREAVIDYLLDSFQELIDNDEQQSLYRLCVDLQVYLVDKVEVLIEDSEEEDYTYQLQVCDNIYVPAFRLHVKAWETYVEKYNKIPRKDSEEKYKLIKAHLAELDAV